MISIACILAGELKDQASQKVDQAKDKANEVASDAKKKGEGKNSFALIRESHLTHGVSPLVRSQARRWTQR